MGTCFVMQPFDQAVFDQRYEDIFVPAIKEAGLEPYRVDQDPKVSIPIQDIETGIRDAAICLAEITTDNPNVWFELGYAIAFRKEVVLVCSKERKTKFPFDIQHRTIIIYPTGSPRDFEKLEKDITTKIKAYIQKAEALAVVSDISKLTKFEGLDHHEVVCLAALAENLQHPEDNTPVYVIKRDMESSGFTKIAATIAIASLLQKNLIKQGEFQDPEFGEYYTGFLLTKEGWKWILSNKDKFVLKNPKTEDQFPF